jgi:methionyl-tRNA formyltransferase
MKLSLAYFGSADFAARLLEKIINDKSLPVEVRLVVTQPDKPAGRKQVLTSTPIKLVAKKYNLDVIDSLTEDLSSKIRGLELALVYAYGQIIPANLLHLPKHGFINIHPSLLPKYRGPAPITYPLILGDKETGVTIIKMDERVDHGPIIAQESLPILPKDRRPDMEARLTNLAYEMFKKTLADLMPKKEQDHSAATYTKRLDKKDGFIPFENLKSALKTNRAGHSIFNLFRGLYPWPGIWTLVMINGRQMRLKITDIDLIDSCLIIKKVQLEGKNEVDFKTFNKAYPVFT